MFLSGQGTDGTEPGRQQALSSSFLVILLLLSVNYTGIEKEQWKGEEEKKLSQEQDVLAIQLMSL